MPLYEFWCQTCGPFEQWRQLSEASTPMICPTCQTEAQRVYSPPGLYRTSSTERSLRHRAEQGAEPRVERRASSDEPTPSAQPHHSHGRPWMLGH